MKMFKKLILTASMILSSLGTSSVANEKINLEFSDTFFLEYSDIKESSFWESYSHTADSILKNLNNIGTYSAIRLHNALNMSEKTTTERFLFLLITGGAKFRFDMANSVFFGHELIHFQNGNLLGGNENYFSDQKTGDKISFYDFYFDLLLSGKTRGPATTKFLPDDYANFISNPKKIQHVSNPLNWQMEYSSRWIEDSLLNEDKTIFDVSDLLINKSYMSLYYLGDLKRGYNKSNILGDPWKYAEHLTQYSHKSKEDNLKKITQINIASLLLSHSMWSAINNYENYTNNSELGIKNNFINTSLGPVTWDIETYQNIENFAIKPKVFFNRKDTSILGGEKVLYSLAIEQSVLGERDSELTLGIHGKWDRFKTSTEISFNNDNQFIEINSGYSLTKNTEIMARANISNGETLKGNRISPNNKTTMSLGINLKF